MFMPEINEVEMNGMLVDEIHLSYKNNSNVIVEVHKLYRYNGNCYLVKEINGKKEI